jgi:lipopolysaccharide transport system ATP-binding protein
VAFAEVDKFLDTPVKRYSSGMYMRLAFAVAAHLEPDILVVDEVLAVGDAQFQKKCLGKMQDVSKGGRTVLFVSHNMSAVLQLTSLGIVLDKGIAVFNGPSEEAVAIYSSRSHAESAVFFDVENLPRKYPGNQAARLISFRFNRTTPIFHQAESFSFFAKVRAHQNIPNVRFSMTVFTFDGSPVGSCFSREQAELSFGGTEEIEITLPNPRLAPGQYHCAVAVGKGDHRTGYTNFDVVLDTLNFEIRPEEGDAGTISAWNPSWGPIVFSELILSGLTKACLF